ncbi:hypothetical protein VMCG_05147 [Cytospora schulzeri]|uniref:Uncharacterized protein n=1 Tax=Cytospora schulzeri TaxID=448051 RepID=A0A423WQI5_9PEZI|nr:hypothetical protein VMCG_05147 [Valsa malicola]
MTSLRIPHDLAQSDRDPLDNGIRLRPVVRTAYGTSTGSWTIPDVVTRRGHAVLDSGDDTKPLEATTTAFARASGFRPQEEDGDDHQDDVSDGADDFGGFLRETEALYNEQGGIQHS